MHAKSQQIIPISPTSLAEEYPARQFSEQQRILDWADLESQRGFIAVTIQSRETARIRHNVTREVFEGNVDELDWELFGSEE